jgi:putative GTP pyrophosphokinase
MLDKKRFLEEYNITEEAFREADIEWEELAKIYESYQKIEGDLRDIGKDFVDDYLYDIEKAGIHSYRYRTKAPGHLIEKVIRKRREAPEKFAFLNHENYYKYFTDLIGIRVFFLYREDWIYFHNYITKVFENNPDIYVENRLEDFDENPAHYYIAERPKVYKRSGDSKIYDERLIDIKAGGIYRFTTLLSTKDIMWKCREERCLKRAGVRLTMILSIRILKMIQCCVIFQHC